MLLDKQNCKIIRSRRKIRSLAKICDCYSSTTENSRLVMASQQSVVQRRCSSVVVIATFQVVPGNPFNTLISRIDGIYCITSIFAQSHGWQGGGNIVKCPIYHKNHTQLVFKIINMAKVDIPPHKIISYANSLFSRFLIVIVES